jgi:hypothetical protein
MLPVLSAWVFLLLDYGRVESACGSSVTGSREDRLCRGLACRVLTSFLANPLRRSCVEQGRGQEGTLSKT